MWIQDLISLLFPRYCKVCKKRLTHSEKHLCISCLLDLPRTHYEQEPNNLLMQHFMEWPEVERATAYFYYYKEGEYSNLIHHLKYYDHPDVGTYLGCLAATELKASSFFEGIDLIIPVPLSRKRYRQRGYNQSDYIAQGISEVTGIPMRTDCVVRTIDTDTQTRKSRDERWKNAKDIFQIVIPEALKGKHILLLDDVCTTGATLHACASALLSIPGLRISIFTLAKTK